MTFFDAFGTAVDRDGDRAIVGAEFGDSPDPLFDVGSAFVFHHDGTAWTEEARLIASDATPYTSFGGSVAIDGDTAADLANATRQAQNAADAGVQIFAVYPPNPVDFDGDEPRPVVLQIREIMQTYADLSGGIFAEVEPDGEGLLDAVLEGLDRCIDLDGDIDEDDLQWLAENGEAAATCAFGIGDCACDRLDLCQSQVYDPECSQAFLEEHLGTSCP